MNIIDEKLFNLIRAFALAGNASTLSDGERLAVMFVCDPDAKAFVTAVKQFYPQTGLDDRGKRVVIVSVNGDEYKEYESALDADAIRRRIAAEAGESSAVLSFDFTDGELQPGRLEQSKPGLRVVESDKKKQALQDKFAIVTLSPQRHAVIARVSTAENSLGVNSVAFYDLASKPGRFRQAHQWLKELREKAEE